MKGLACAKCFDIRALPRDNLTPVSCQCGNTTGWWLDGRQGTARYTAEAPYAAWGVGFNNRFLVAVFSGYGAIPDSEKMRACHDQATDAPGYYFDKSRYGCWAVLFKPGNATGVEWANDAERAAVGLAPYPIWHALAPKSEPPPSESHSEPHRGTTP